MHFFSCLLSFEQSNEIWYCTYSLALKEIRSRFCIYNDLTVCLWKLKGIQWTSQTSCSHFLWWSTVVTSIWKATHNFRDCFHNNTFYLTRTFSYIHLKALLLVLQLKMELNEKIDTTLKITVLPMPSSNSH